MGNTRHGGATYHSAFIDVKKRVVEIDARAFENGVTVRTVPYPKHGRGHHVTDE